MSNAEFDRYARDYDDLHKRNLGASGEEPAYFSDYKMRDFAALVSAAGLPQDGRYLDFGSGVGAAVAPFRKYLARARLVCADVSSESLSVSTGTHGDAAEYALISGQSLPFGDAQFDGAFACCVFHHIPHDRHEQALSEIRRVLKPGGLLMVYEHNPFNPLTVRAVNTCPFDENAVLLTADKLRRTCDRAGFARHRTNYRVFFPAMFAGLRPLENFLRWFPLGAQYFVSSLR